MTDAGKTLSRGGFLTLGSQLHLQVGGAGPLPGSGCFPPPPLLPRGGLGLEGFSQAEPALRACWPGSHAEAIPA